MSRKPYILSVRGRTTPWDFDVWERPEDVKVWREDDLQIYGPVLNSVPQWAQRLGLTHIWFWPQDKGVIRV